MILQSRGVLSLELVWLNISKTYLESTSPLLEFMKSTHNQPKYDYINQSKEMDEYLMGGYEWKGAPSQVLRVPIQRYLHWVLNTTPIDQHLAWQDTDWEVIPHKDLILFYYCLFNFLKYLRQPVFIFGSNSVIMKWSKDSLGEVCTRSNQSESWIPLG